MSFRLRPASFEESPLSLISPLPPSPQLPGSFSSPSPTISSTRSGKRYTKPAYQPSGSRIPVLSPVQAIPASSIRPPSPQITLSPANPSSASTSVPTAALVVKSLLAHPSIIPTVSPSIAPVTMTSTTTGLRGMPGRTSKDAPSFSGRPKDLLDFFAQFEDLADSCGLTSQEKCRTVL